VLEPIADQTMSHNEDTLTLALAASDAEGDDLSYFAEILQGNAAVSLAGNVLTIDPADGFAGTVRVHVTTSDGIARKCGEPKASAAPGTRIGSQNWDEL
jgi:hypothetical protein